MMPIEFRPTLLHCVETLAKREYRESLHSYMASTESNKELAEKLETLRLFLESADFSKLRAESEKQLSEGRNVRFILSLKNGRPEINLIAE